MSILYPINFFGQNIPIPLIPMVCISIMPVTMMTSLSVICLGT